VFNTLPSVSKTLPSVSKTLTDATSVSKTLTSVLKTLPSVSRTDLCVGAGIQGARLGAELLLARGPPTPGFRVQGSGFRVQGSGFRVQGPGFRVQDLEADREFKQRERRHVFRA